MNQIKVTACPLVPSQVAEGKSEFSPSSGLLSGIHKIHAPRANFLNRVAKYSAIAGGIASAIGIAGAASVIAIDMDPKDKLDLGGVSIGLFVVGFLCCGFSNCLYYHGYSSAEVESVQFDSTV